MPFLNETRQNIFTRKSEIVREFSKKYDLKVSEVPMSKVNDKDFLGLPIPSGGLWMSSVQ